MKNAYKASIWILIGYFFVLMGFSLWAKDHRCEILKKQWVAAMTASPGELNWSRVREIQDALIESKCP